MGQSLPPGRHFDARMPSLHAEVVTAVAMAPWVTAFNTLAEARTLGLAIPIHQVITGR